MRYSVLCNEFWFQVSIFKKAQNVIADIIVRDTIHDALPCNWVFVIPSSVRSLLERMGWFVCLFGFC